VTPAPPRGRRAAAALATILALSAGAIALTHVRSAGPGDDRAGVTAGHTLVPAVRSMLVAQLHAERLSFRDVVCVRNGRMYRGHPVVRCNVNFGDPHIEAYCGVLMQGRLITNHRNPSISCRPDEAGRQVQIFSSR